MNKNICLCYNADKGFYIQNCHSCSEAIFTTYDTIGRKQEPAGNFNIRIESKFNSDSNSYLYAEIEYNGRQLLDFAKDKILVLDNCSVTKFSVPSEDWDELFKKIVDAYSNKTSNACPTSAIRYVDELCKILNSVTLLRLRGLCTTTIQQNGPGVSLQLYSSAIN